MKVPFSWLKELVDIDVTAQELEEKLFSCGFEVEELIPLDAGISKVVVGKIVEMEPQEGTHLTKCVVDCGEYGHDIRISTGAANMKLGDCVPAALDGSTLPGGIKIKARKMQGVESNGMLCSGEELGLNDDLFPGSEVYGLLILPEDSVPGTDIAPVVGLDDYIFDISITANRPDCQSVLGIAREVAAILGKPLHMPAMDYKAVCEPDAPITVQVEAPDLCPRYMAHYVRNIRMGESPRWMKRHLALCGLRSISNVVDITNHTLLEMGQPMHAFDYRYVKGGHIIVRRAEEGEELTTLDGNVRKLTANHLVIADEHRAVGLAGIMGGLNSEIVADTTDVVFESACFDGTCIRKGALSLGMRTEASAKFEKGLDPLNTLPAVQRACELVELLGAGEVVDGVIDILNYVPQPHTIRMDPERVNALLGTDIPAAEQYRYLARVDIRTADDSCPGGPADVTIPSWRGDVEGIADLAEEVARFYGYNNIPTTLMRGQTTLGGYGAAEILERRVSSVCRAFGYDEIITYSFISPTQYDKIRWPEDYQRRNSFKILNPLGEDTSIMRTTTLPSMLEILTRNYNYRNQDVKLYEVGRTYLPGGEDGLAIESKTLTLGAYGGDMDFYAMKGAIEAILQELRVKDVTFRIGSGLPEELSYHPGRFAEVWSGSDCLGWFGQIHPLVAKNYGVDAEFYCAELAMDELENAKGADPEYVPLPKFPAVTRDIAVVCDRAVTVGALEDCIRRGAKGLLKDVSLFDIYTGSGIPEGKKSVAFNLTLRSDDRSLTAQEADEDVKSILETLKAELNAVLR